MRMKRFAVIMTFFALLAMFTVPAYSADDDSTPYMPYPEQPRTQPTNPAPKKKTPAKKPAPKKKTPAKKPAPKKTTARTNPSRPSSLQQAITLINQGKYKEAKPYLLSAINANKNDPNVWYWYGVWHEKLGCYHEAQFFYTKALKIDPSFDPLSRVAYYPEDPDKIPLWDPKRPARIYPVETGDRNFTRVPPFGRDSTTFPNAPENPVIPRVPAYTPPEPGSNPLEGDAWTPSVYVPPSPNNPNVPNGTPPVYMPPQGPIESERRVSIDIEIARREPSRTETSYNDRDRIIRADLPLYTPPEPGRRVTPPPATTAPRVTEQPQRQPTRQHQPTVPRRVVRQTKTTPSKTSQPRTQTVRQNTTRTTQPRRRTETARTTSPDVRPVQPQTTRPAQPTRPTQPQTTRQRPRQPETPQVQPEVREPETQRQPTRQTNRQEYMPPVGQYAPDPGTISENPIPPVGQGNQD